MNRWILLALLLGGCGEPSGADTKVIVGATLLNGTDRMEHSVIVVRDGRIAAMGPQQSTPIPAGSEKVNGIGKYVVSANRGERIAPGAPADLLLMSADARIERRMVGGKWVDQ
jgi:dihydroorotase-like cyclic amidohydrolase